MKRSTLLTAAGVLVVAVAMATAAIAIPRVRDARRDRVISEATALIDDLRAHVVVADTASLPSVDVDAIEAHAQALTEVASRETDAVLTANMLEVQAALYQSSGRITESTRLLEEAAQTYLRSGDGEAFYRSELARLESLIGCGDTLGAGERAVILLGGTNPAPDPATASSLRLFAARGALLRAAQTPAWDPTGIEKHLDTAEALLAGVSGEDSVRAAARLELDRIAAIRARTVDRMAVLEGVVRIDGTGRAGIGVCLTPADQSSEPTAAYCTTTNSGGAYRIALLPPDDYLVWLHVPPARLPVKTGAHRESVDVEGLPEILTLYPSHYRLLPIELSLGED